MPISPSPAPVPPRGQRRHFLESPAAGLGVLLCLALGWGCSKQAEGERCDQNNGDLDCDTGLICKGEAALSIKGRGFALCCLATGESTVDACRAAPGLPPETDAGATSETPLTNPTETPAPVTDSGTEQPDAATVP